MVTSYMTLLLSDKKRCRQVASFLSVKDMRLHQSQIYICARHTNSRVKIHNNYTSYKM